MERNVETFLGCDKTFEEARIVIFGAPFDSTTSYRPGTRFASRTMRAESYGLETYSPYQDLDLEDAAVFDGETWNCVLAMWTGRWEPSRISRQRSSRRAGCRS